MADFLLESVLFLIAAAVRAEGDASRPCRELLLQLDQLSMDEIEFRLSWHRQGCDERMMADRGRASLLVKPDEMRPTSALPDDTATCRTLLRLMDANSPSRSQAATLEFDKLDCAQKMLADKGQATVLVDDASSVR